MPETTESEEPYAVGPLADTVETPTREAFGDGLEFVGEFTQIVGGVALAVILLIVLYLAGKQYERRQKR